MAQSPDIPALRYLAAQAIPSPAFVHRGILSPADFYAQWVNAIKTFNNQYTIFRNNARLLRLCSLQKQTPTMRNIGLLARRSAGNRTMQAAVRAGALPAAFQLQ